MKKQSFSVKDLINAGVFTLLVFLATFIGGFIGFIPVFMPFLPFLCALISGPVFMLYSTKIHRFGMVLIMGTIIGLLFTVTGHGIYILVAAIIFSLVGELILKKGGDYENLNNFRWCYAIFSLTSAFNMVPMFIAREAYIQKIVDQGYGQEYADKIMGLLPNWSFIPIMLLGALGGYLGATIGIKMLQKHFNKLGMA